MGIYVTFLLPLLALTELVQHGSTEEYHIIQGKYDTSKMRFKFHSTRRFPPFELCKLGPEPEQIRLVCKVVKTDLRGRDLYLRLEAMKPVKRAFRKAFETYEVENSNMSPNKLMGGTENYREIIKKYNLCKLFKLESFPINGVQHHIMKFMYHGDEWCGVYTTNSYKYKETDLCTDVFENFDLKKTKFSVGIPSSSDFSAMWTPCNNNEKQVKICDKPPNFEIRASPFCAGPMKYNIITYYNGYSLGTYKILYPLEPKKEDLPKFCKLFKFKFMDNKYEQVGVQFFNKGEWVCELFQRGVHEHNPAYLNKHWPLTKKCERFPNHSKIKPINKWYRKMGKGRTE